MMTAMETTATCDMGMRFTKPKHAVRKLHVECFEFPFVQGVSLHQTIHPPHVVRVILFIRLHEEGECLPQHTRLLVVLRQRDEMPLSLGPVTVTKSSFKTQRLQ